MVLGLDHNAAPGVTRAAGIARQQFPPKKDFFLQQCVATERKKVLRKLSHLNQYTAAQT
jgi:hypothetical protein